MWFAVWLILSLALIKLYNKYSIGKCYSRAYMTGKVVIVTGGNNGIGYETALNLAKRGAKVVLGCRDRKKGDRAVKSIVKKSKNTSVRCIHLDLSSLASVRKFVDEFKAGEAKLDVLINNAGTSGLKQHKTEDGLVYHIQVNHLGPFLLTLLLVPLLKKSEAGRVINVSSMMHKFGTIKDLNRENYYSYLRAYCNSKLCNVLFSNELARRLEGTGVVSNSLHPGQVNTSLYRSTIFEKLRTFALYSFFKSPPDGAQTSIYLAVSEDCDQVTGKYFEDCEEAKPSPKALDEEMAMKLWQQSEELVKLRPEEAICEN